MNHVIMNSKLVGTDLTDDVVHSVIFNLFFFQPVLANDTFEQPHSSNIYFFTFLIKDNSVLFIR
jgi:hypothetical protein